MSFKKRSMQVLKHRYGVHFFSLLSKLDLSITDEAIIWDSSVMRVYERQIKEYRFYKLYDDRYEAPVV